MKCCLGEPCCSYVPDVVADNEVEIVPGSTTTATSLEGPSKPKPISSECGIVTGKLPFRTHPPTLGSSKNDVERSGILFPAVPHENDLPVNVPWGVTNVPPNHYS
ncbi:hypothetical protein PHET_08554 [Paragonimus heterotremus]|uniref:Uncharacterized protein n=1 Tax=Paragonimus heterotremus TaxID=100268 RepID=A0A8J4TCQ1_9TREM|nr:hypothetical protein PHET_08554 [Paragonimus heterotremus]